MSVVELDDGYALFEAQTGFAGRVNFERHAFWQEKECVYWVSAASAALPWRLRLGAWPGSAPARAYRAWSAARSRTAIANWALEGPQTWEDRKKRRIDRSRPFGDAGSPPATLPPLAAGEPARRVQRRG